MAKRLREPLSADYRTRPRSLALPCPRGNFLVRRRGAEDVDAF